MRYLYLPVLLLLFTVGTLAQTSSDSSGLTVLQKKWRVNAVKSSDPTLNEDPFRANDETNQRISDQKELVRQNQIRQQAGLPALPPTTRRQRGVVQTTSVDPSTNYTYQIKVQNNGAKTIKKVIWEHGCR